MSCIKHYTVIIHSSFLCGRGQAKGILTGGLYLKQLFQKGRRKGDEDEQGQEGRYDEEKD
jgi:hypothetical protein